MKKFGTFSGVFVPSFEAILGAVLFLLIPSIAGEMGLFNMLLIVLLSNTITTATAFSISDCATNLQNIGSGGMFAIAKRSLGKAFGGSIGIQLFLAQAMSIGFYAIAFATPLQSVIVDAFPFIKSFVMEHKIPVLMQQQVIATVIGFIAFLAGIIGADFIIKLQMIIFVILIASVGSILVSPFLGLKTASGASLFMKNPNMMGTFATLGFWTAFTTFFPAVTGIDAGVGMSGSLKDPRKSLGKGTFWAIGITTVVYVLISIIFSYVPPEMVATVIEEGKDPITKTALDVFEGIPFIPELILAGILFATGSSALSYFMTAPRTAQTLATDNLLPRAMGIIGKDFTKEGNEPRWATVLTFLIVVPVIWAGDVRFASELVGIAFLVVYGWVNLAAFFERISGNPSFRPTSKGHWLISLFGFVMAMVVIAMNNPIAGILIILSQIIIFILLLKFKSNNKMEGVWWGLLFSWISWGFKRMNRIIQGSKNWRPIVDFFCFADNEEETNNALEMARRISDYKGLSLINVFKPAKMESPSFHLPEEAQVVTAPAETFDRSIMAITQAALPGGFQANTVLLPIDKRLNLTNLVEDIMAMGKNVLLYKDGQRVEHYEDRIDVWWKGEENGNLMALLSFIINESDKMINNKNKKIRIIRKLFNGEDTDKARAEMEHLMSAARLSGEVLILNEDTEPFQETLKKHSQDATLVLMGMPGKKSGGLVKMFSLNKHFVTKELEKYTDLPPILFVKAAGILDLIEDV